MGHGSCSLFSFLSCNLWCAAQVRFSYTVRILVNTWCLDFRNELCIRWWVTKRELLACATLFAVSWLELLIYCTQLLSGSGKASPRATTVRRDLYVSELYLSQQSQLCRPCGLTGLSTCSKFVALDFRYLQLCKQALPWRSLCEGAQDKEGVLWRTWFLLRHTVTSFYVYFDILTLCVFVWKRYCITSGRSRDDFIGIYYLGVRAGEMPHRSCMQSWCGFARAHHERSSCQLLNLVPNILSLIVCVLKF